MKSLSWQLKNAGGFQSALGLAFSGAVNWTRPLFGRPSAVDIYNTSCYLAITDVQAPDAENPPEKLAELRILARLNEYNGNVSRTLMSSPQIFRHQTSARSEDVSEAARLLPWC
jgi:hypothetical protein